MMYRVRRSFVDPFTGRAYLRGNPYNGEHGDYFERHGLIERINMASAEQSAEAELSKKKPKRQKARR